MSFVDVFGGGLKVMAIGMVMVFVGLILLILGITLLRLIISRVSPALKENKPGKSDVPVAVSAAQPAATNSAVLEEEEIAVVISAAIAAYVAGDAAADPSRLVVRRIQRVGRNTPVWSNPVRN